MTFNTESSLERLTSYVENSGPFDDMYLMLFNHGTEGIGLSSIDDWKAVLGLAKDRGQLIGLREDLYPRDFGSFARYVDAIKSTIPARYPIPAPLPLSTLLEFLRVSARKYKISALEEP
jgi:hypothetical protein